MSSNASPVSGHASSRRPVAIGGVGGSGTRLIAAMLAGPDFFIGGDLNGALDNLWFTLLFKRRDALMLDDGAFAELAAIFTRAMDHAGPLSQAQRAIVSAAAAVPRPQHPPEWLRERARTLVEAAERSDRVSRPWGWKEPNTHVALERLRQTMPALKYIHVVRNGLDMAYSSNQNQVEFWGPQLLGLREVEPTPALALKYWCAVHRRVLSIASRMGDDFFWLNYDALCLQPAHELPKLLAFLGLTPSRPRLRAMIRTIATPASLGRYKATGLAPFDPSDVEYVAQLGFTVSRP